MRNTVFLADDDDDDVFVFKSALRDIDGDSEFKSFVNGSSLMQYLLEKELPDVLFLDINMPVKSGYDCLKEIRNNKKLKDLCVIMYSTSNHARDINLSLELKADAYVQKPSNFNKLKELLKKIMDTDFKDVCHSLSNENFVINA